eukprot:CAMPEP_0185746506 /NCGR_PEP_ID=MMETSP1174-20130828/5081_1 /TAXON_ID=35687 /ORGANISM="Dictyocha speculum, Strain CCMP1381" /LENGTH=76 /DNA_ID=CAMNT_0028421247 /DNA_START=600 /DNA_END=831 /DNA_ORIENTATION=+
MTSSPVETRLQLGAGGLVEEDTLLIPGRGDFFNQALAVTLETFCEGLSHKGDLLKFNDSTSALFEKHDALVDRCNL